MKNRFNGSVSMCVTLTGLSQVNRPGFGCCVLDTVSEPHQGPIPPSRCVSLTETGQGPIASLPPFLMGGEGVMENAER